ncbi:uncharacterized protein EI90DRAFT_1727103 [Cantharellus anzutake]|uniref:uncharacterized protein n=1 Tax=Cantharellus anzutake TaxID=1750568 RepID=UPI001902EAD0|nr:uncharacterized protein EI90DRAFT_1727103 [Cantharellus anzutake]KAF8341365.1 hypothetical protein EI90DRAFT_1727103 [Cantharellus anzutake]
MPKIVSRSAVSTSTDAVPTESASASLKVYYCLCGEFALVIDKDITLLPRRKTDGALILRAQGVEGQTKAQIFKLNVNISDPIFIKRDNSLELQYRYTCTRCTLPIGYQTTPPIKSGPYVYLIHGSVTQQQGVVPHAAFEGENETYEALRAREELEINPPSTAPE